jgi:hypothetical protein
VQVQELMLAGAGEWKKPGSAFPDAEPVVCTPLLPILSQLPFNLSSLDNTPFLPQEPVAGV